MSVRTCCLCLKPANYNEFVCIFNTREECLKPICLTVKSKNDFAHKNCLECIGLLEAPKSKSQRRNYPAAFQKRLEGIIKGLIDGMQEVIAQMCGQDAFTAVMDHVIAFMPIAKPTRLAIDNMKALVQRLLEERGKPTESINASSESTNPEPQILDTIVSESGDPTTDQFEDDSKLVAALPLKERIQMLRDRHAITVKFAMDADVRKDAIRQVLAVVSSVTDAHIRKDLLSHAFSQPENPLKDSARTGNKRSRSVDHEVSSHTGGAVTEHVFVDNVISQ